MKAIQNFRRLTPFMTLFLFLNGCGSEDGGGGSSTGGSGGASTGGTTSTGGASGVGGASGSGGASTGGAGNVGNVALLAPVIQMVMPMEPAGLHVTWTNSQTDCDSVEGERKTATAEWAAVFSVPGYVDNEHDAAATDPVAYTYRLRCKKGADYSSYSNEMSGTPE